MASAGSIRTLVSLVDRSPFDDAAYPVAAADTLLLPAPPSDASAALALDGVTAAEVVEVGPAGDVAWGGRMTFTLVDATVAAPGDALQWLALRIVPTPWLPPPVVAALRAGSCVPTDPSAAWRWVAPLATAALARVELEVGGVVLEAWPGEWADVWTRVGVSAAAGAALDDAAFSGAGVLPSDDGAATALLPFWFGRGGGPPLPLGALGRSTPVRVHVTLRPFDAVVRQGTQRRTAADCGIGPLKPTVHSFVTVSGGGGYTAVVGPAAPPPLSATLLVGVAHMARGPRVALFAQPREYAMETVAADVFAEPLAYTTATMGRRVTVTLPLTVANGPLRAVLWVLRRAAAVDAFRAWVGPGAYAAPLEDENDGVRAPLLRSAALWIGGTKWASQSERECRATAGRRWPGGARAYGSFVYAFAFAEAPGVPAIASGSLNASAAGLDAVRLELTVEAPPATTPQGTASTQWSVHVFVLGANWMRTQNGMAGLVFTD